MVQITFIPWVEDTSKQKKMDRGGLVQAVYKATPFPSIAHPMIKCSHSHSNSSVHSFCNPTILFTPTHFNNSLRYKFYLQ